MRVLGVLVAVVGIALVALGVLAAIGIVFGTSWPLATVLLVSCAPAGLVVFALGSYLQGHRWFRGDSWHDPTPAEHRWLPVCSQCGAKHESLTGKGACTQCGAELPRE